MTKKPENLRLKAERLLAQRETGTEEMSVSDFSSLVHELRVYQVELELQNEELRKSQVALETARRHYQVLWQFSPVGYVIANGSGRVTAVNRAGTALFGRPKKSIVMQHLAALVAPDDRIKVSLTLEKAWISGVEESCEVMIRSLGGSMRICQMACKAEPGLSKKTGRIQSIFTDVTSQKEQQEALLKLQDHLRVALEGGNMGIWDWDLKTGGMLWNERLYDLIGRDPHGPPIDGETLLGYVHEEDIERVREHLAKVLDSGGIFRDDFRIVRDDGKIKWIASSARVYRDAAGRPSRFAGVNYDITEQINTQAELVESYNQLDNRVRERTAELEKEIARRRRYEANLKASTGLILEEHQRRIFLSGRLVDLLERDRKAIGSALHDEIGQLLTTISAGAKTTKDLLETDRGAAGRQLEAMLEWISTAIRYVKNISRQLRPDILDHLGLAQAIENLVHTITVQSGLRVNHFIKGIPAKMEPDKELNIYRTVQESLNNIVKHARAENAFVSLIRQPGRIILTIEDDGIGFNYIPTPEQTGNPSDHLGIVIMMERAALVGGELRVESAPGKGTQVVAEIPI